MPSPDPNAQDLPTASSPPPPAVIPAIYDRRSRDHLWRIAKKFTIWAAFFGILYLLSEFMALIIITFVACYILNGVAEQLMARFQKKRRPIVTGIFSVL